MTHYIQRGESVQCNWSLYDLLKQPFSLEGLTCKLYYIVGRGRSIAKDVVHQDNVLSWSFAPDAQWATGSYTLLLELYNSGGKVISVDYTDAFYLGESIPTTASQQYAELLDSAATIHTIDIQSAHDIHKLTPVIPVVGSDGYWYVNGVKVVDGDGQPVPASHTLKYYPASKYLVIDEGRVDKDGASISVTITDLADALGAQQEAYSLAEQARDRSYLEAEKQRQDTFDELTKPLYISPEELTEEISIQAMDLLDAGGTVIVLIEEDSVKSRVVAWERETLSFFYFDKEGSWTTLSIYDENGDTPVAEE